MHNFHRVGLKIIYFSPKTMIILVFFGVVKVQILDIKRGVERCPFCCTFIPTLGSKTHTEEIPFLFKKIHRMNCADIVT